MLNYEGCASVRVFADFLVYRYFSKKWNIQFFSYLSSASRLEYVDFSAAIWADKPAHVFHNAYNGHSKLSCKRYSLFNNNLRDLRRNSHDYHAIDFWQNWAILNGSSPVPGGKSMSKMSNSPHAISDKN